jgi:hypothetical protein
MTLPSKEQHTMVILFDQPADLFCEERGWVSINVPEDDARDLLAPYCADVYGRQPARPIGPAKRVWLAADDLSKPADEQLWHPCPAGEGVEFWEFDATDTSDAPKREADR